MKKFGPINLTRKTAVQLIRSVVPVSPKAVEGGRQAPGVITYTARTGALDITCSNDWFACNGRIELTIADRLGGSSIRMYFHPDTLNRDFRAEDVEKAEERQMNLERLVGEVGKKRAHELVDKHWG